MKKNLWIIILLMMSLIWGAVSYLHYKIEREVRKGLNDAMTVPVHIDSVRVHLLSSVVLNRVSVPDPLVPSQKVLTARQVKIAFNPLRLFHTLDPVELIHTVSLTGGHISVRHLADDRFTFLALLKPGPSPKTQHLDMKVKLKKCQLDYPDQRGFGAVPLKTTQTNRLLNLSGQIELGAQKIRLALKGQLNRKEAPLSIQGFIASNNYEIRLHSGRMEMAEVANYFMGLKDIRVLKAKGKVDLVLRPREVRVPTDLPVQFDAQIHVEEGRVSTSWLSPVLLFREGKIILNNEGIKLQDLRAQSAGEFFHFGGDIVRYKEIHLVVTANRLQGKRASTFLPFLKTWNLDGQYDLHLAIEGEPETTILLRAKISGYSGHIWQYSVENAALVVTKNGSEVSFEIPSLNAYDGTGSGEGWVRLSDEHPHEIHLNMLMEDVSLERYFDSKHFLGRGTVGIHLGNFVDEISGAIDFTGKNAKVFGQVLQNASFLIKKTPDQLTFLSGSSLQFNQSREPLFVTGNLGSDQRFQVAIKGRNLESPNLYFFHTQVGQYDARFHVMGAFEGVYDDSFRQSPLLHTVGSADIGLESLTVSGTATPLTGKGTLSLDKIVNLDFDLRAGLSQAGIRARTTDKGLIDSRFIIRNFPLRYVRPFVKDAGFYYSGLASADITLFPDPNNQTLLKNFGVHGQVELSQANIAGVSMNAFSGHIQLSDQRLRLSQATLIQPYSNLTFSLDFQSTHNFKVRLGKSRLRSTEWPAAPPGFNFSLKEIEGEISRQGDQMDADLDLQTEYMLYKNIALPAFDGRVGIAGSEIFFRPLKVGYMGDSFLVSGNMTTDVFRGKIPRFDVEVKVGKAYLDHLFTLYSQLKPLWFKEALPQVKKAELQKRESMKNYSQLIKNNYIDLYSLRGKSILNTIENMRETSQKDVLSDLPKIEGLSRGSVKVSNKGQLSFTSDLSVENARIFQTQIKKIRLLAERKDRDIRIFIRGDGLNLLDNILDKVVFTAEFDPDAKSLRVENLSTYVGNEMYDHILGGRVALDDLDLNLSLRKDNINLIAFLIPSLKRLSNNGEVELRISGPLRRPVVRSETFQLRQFEAQFRQDFPVRSPLRVEKADLSIRENRLRIPDLKISWKGEDTNGVENAFSLKGEMAFDLLSNPADILPIRMDLKMEPAKLDINFPDLYSGKVNLEETRLAGTLRIPMSRKAKENQRKSVLEEKEEGPVFTTVATFYDGRFIILANRAASLDKPSIKMQVPVMMGKDLFIARKEDSAAINNFLNTLLIELEELPGAIPVKGSLNTLDLDHRFRLKSGKLVFLNQIFQLLERPLQREIFRNSPEKINDNTVEIRMAPDPDSPGKRKPTPYFDLKAYAIVKKSVDVSSNSTALTGTETQEHLFVININGFLNTPKAFSIQHYLVDNGNYKPQGEQIELDKITSEQLDTLTSYLLPVLLRPQFYQTLLSKGLGNNKEANELVKGYSASQINLWIDQQLRPVEKEVAKATGLYDVRIQHKLGEEIMNAVPVFSGTEQGNAATAKDNKVSVEYIKDLFVKKLFVKVKTGLTQDPVSKSLAYRMTEYELMWFLNDFISVNYANHNLQASDTLYGAFSLNANFDF